MKIVQIKQFITMFLRILSELVTVKCMKIIHVYKFAKSVKKKSTCRILNVNLVSRSSHIVGPHMLIKIKPSAQPTFS